MYISTNNTINTGLTSLLDATLNGVAQTYSGSNAAGFGPAAWFSTEGTTSSSYADDVYSQLAAIQLQSQSAAPVSAPLSEADQNTIKQAAALRINGQYDEARSLLDGLIKKNPTNGLVVHGLGAIELDQGNFPKAEAYFGKAHYLAPEYGFDTDALNAKILQQDDQYVLEQAEIMTKDPDRRDDGVRLLLALTKRAPSDAVARTMLAENLILQGQAQQGLSQFQLAISSANEAQAAQIESKLEALVEIAPRAAYLQNLLGQVQLKLGKHELAAETLAYASSLSDGASNYTSDEAQAYVALGRDALESGNLIEAMSQFEAAYALDPQSDDVNRAMAEGYLARSEYKTRVGDPGRAIEELTQAKSYLAAIDDGDEELQSHIATAFYNAGRVLEYRRIGSDGEIGDEQIAFQAAYELDPENLTYQRKLAETQSLLGDQYLAEGDYKNAAYAYQHAYEVYDTETTYRDNAISAFMTWGDERVDARDHGQAIAAYQAAYDLDNDNETSKFSLAEAFNRRGLFYASLGGDFDSEAAEDFLAALDLYPDNEDYQNNYDSVV